MMKLEDSVGESSSINVDMKSNPTVDKSNVVGTRGDHHPSIKEEAWKLDFEVLHVYHRPFSIYKLTLQFKFFFF